MRKMYKFTIIFIILVVIILTSYIQYNVTSNPTFKVDHIEFKVIKGLRIATDGKYAYVLEPFESGNAINIVKIEDGKVEFERLITIVEVSRGPRIPIIIYIEGDDWNITLEGDQFLGLLLIDIFSFNNSVYTAGTDILKVKDGKVMWIKELTINKVGYEGTRDDPKPVYYSVNLDVFDMESDGKYIYLNAGPIIKTDDNLNIIWAVWAGRIYDIAVSDGIYCVEGNKILKLDKNGEAEWAIALKSDEKIKLEIPEEKRRIAEIEGKGVPKFIEVERYSVNIFTLYAEDCVYVAGIFEVFREPKAYPFIAKLSASGNILWIKILNSTYPGCSKDGCFVRVAGKILKHNERTFIAWIDRVLLIFNENGKIIDYYEVEGVCDIDLIGNTILMTSVEPEKVNIKKMKITPTQIDIKAVKKSFEIKYVGKQIKLVERYSNQRSLQ